MIHAKGIQMYIIKYYSQSNFHFKLGWNAHEFICWCGGGGAYIMLSPWNLSQTTGQLTKLHRHRWNLDFIICKWILFSISLFRIHCVSTDNGTGQEYSEASNFQVYKVSTCENIIFFRTFHNIFPSVSLFTF